MCGIAGFVGEGDRNVLLNMMQTLNHRGPDDEGVHINGTVYLAHKRLSIIDLSEDGRQPMSNEDGSVWMVFNGEIYNFQPLRQLLLDKGHTFRSKTDSEVVVHLYEEYGTEMLEKLNGMFAFAIWDGRQQKLFLARDRMGQKPVYYSFINNTFIFASEARALLKHPFINRRLNVKSLAKFLFYEHVPTPDCIWENVSKLTPASYLVYEPVKRSYQVERYWKIRFLPRLCLTESERYEALEERLTEAVKRHLVADVPMGVYLSGGIDSSTIAYYSQKILNGRLKTFTVAFEELTFDEQHQARQTANYLGTEHHEVAVGVEEFVKTTLDIIPKLDEPFADSSFIPAYYLNRFARDFIKVSLGGEGGDEIFVGYPIYRAHELLKYLRAIPTGFRKKVVLPLINSIRSSYKNETWEYRLKKFIEAEGYLHNPYYCQQIWLGAFGPEHLLKLFKSEFHHAIGMDGLFDNIDFYRRDAEVNEELIDGLMRQTQHKYLMDDGLTKTDRASMLNGIEMRAPLLDNELVEWVNRLPFHYKYKKGETKVILRRLMNDKLPEGVLSGCKRGFTPPIAEWFARHFQKQIKEYIFGDNNLFDVSYIKKLWDEHILQKQNHRKLIWTLFIWKLWCSENIK